MSRPAAIREWQQILVYGLGISGRAAVALAVARGQEVIAVDDNPDLSLDRSDPRVDYQLGTNFDLPETIGGVVISPGISSDSLLLTQASALGIPVTSEVEFAYQWSDSGSFIGITGSNGKSTTTALTGEILQRGGHSVAVCGNFGLPLSSAVQDPVDYYVVELSSFQLERIDAFHPRVAAWLNLSFDHLDRHGTMSDYAQAKAAIFRNQTADDTAILNLDDPVVCLSQSAAHQVTFSTRRQTTEGCHLDGDQVVEISDGRRLPLFSPSDSTLPGLHNLENAMAASLIGRSLSVSREIVRDAVRSFRGLPHRSELVAEIDGVRYYNDSKGTNPAASARSLTAFGANRVHLIVGGRSKGVELGEFVAAADGRVKRSYGIGEAGQELIAALSAIALGDDCGDLEAAVSAAFKSAEPGDVVLLSPACASYDQYRNFEERGDHFRLLVEQLSGVQGG